MRNHFSAVSKRALHLVPPVLFLRKTLQHRQIESLILPKITAVSQALQTCLPIYQVHFSCSGYIYVATGVTCWRPKEWHTSCCSWLMQGNTVRAWGDAVVLYSFQYNAGTCPCGCNYTLSINNQITRIARVRQAASGLQTDGGVMEAWYMCSTAWK